MTPEILLSKISSISKAYDRISMKTGACFNIFQIADIASNEVSICKVLYELLNPKGCHHQGTVYLELFMRQALKIDDFDYATAEVYREYAAAQNRRIDLVIKNTACFIPIEVKIYAEDQRRQCYDYYQTARGADKKVYYLTLHGTPPSEYSAKGLTTDGEDSYEEVRLLSFENDILEWLYACVSHRTTMILSPIREIIIQLISAIRTLTGQLEEGKELEMKELLMQSSENAQSAFAIESVLKEIKISMLKKIFFALEKKCSELGLHKVEIDDTLTVEKRIEIFYNKKGSSYPSLAYRFKNNVAPDTDILFRIVVDNRLFCGFCMARNKKLLKEYDYKLMKDHLPHVELKNSDSWFAYWIYLPLNDMSASPNFKGPDLNDNNDPYLKLYDKDYFEDFISKCAKAINDLNTLYSGK
jgi:hypothetical protein